MGTTAQRAIVVLLLVAGCESAPRHVGVGDVLEVDAATQQALIRHDRIDGLMDAKTTRFTVPEDDVRAVLAPGARVRFEVRRAGDAWMLTRANLLSQGNPGLHDHTPHHGGVVAMAGMLHLEAKASPDGRVQLYLTDIWRRPLPLDGVRGSVTLDLPAGKQQFPLAASDGALAAQGPALAAPALNAAFALQREGQNVAVHFRLPLDPGASGAAGIPAAGCMPPAAGAAPGAPRCALHFAKPVAAVALAPDAASLLVAQVDFGISAWRLPAGQFARGFAPPPPVVTAAVAEAPHPEAPNALLIRPDGREAVMATENRLVFYAMQSGQVARAFAGPGGIVRAVAWAPDGGALLVSIFYDATAYVLDAADGRVRQRLPVEREGAALAWAADGTSVAVGSETGTVSLFDLAAPSAPARELHGARGAVRALAFVGEELVAAGDDGMLRVWSRADGSLRRELRIGRTVYAMAVNAPRGLAAAVGMEPHIKLIDLASAAPIGTLSWDRGQILGLAWSDATLVSGDTSGTVAIWALPEPRAAEEQRG